MFDHQEEDLDGEWSDLEAYESDRQEDEDLAEYCNQVEYFRDWDELEPTEEEMDKFLGYSDVELSEDQHAAIEQIEGEDGPFCIMGGAGTGKSFLVREMIKRFKPYVCASTGIAAQNVGGTTLHSMLSMRPQSDKPNFSKVYKNLAGSSMVIVDEISMVNDWLFSHLIEGVRYVSPRIKIVVVGDFMQLPPVEGGFAFKSKYWKEVTPIVLKTQHRQKDQDFIDALYDLRVGHETAQLLKLMRDRYTYYPPKDGTQLAAKNEVVAAINRERLQELPGKEYTFKWSCDICDKFTTVKMLYNRCRFLPELTLKINAKVLLLTNTEFWCNGSTGWVEDIRVGGVIRVRLMDGSLVSVERAVEEVVNGSRDVIAKVNQYPLKLAYALTIHKAQGMSLDKVVINLNNHWACGQTYVALSRCKTKEGLFLFGNYKYTRPNLEALRVCEGNAE